MKAKIIILLTITMLITTSYIANASLIKQNKEENVTMIFILNDHKVQLDANSWDGFDTYKKALKGDVEVVANANSQGGHAHTKCDHGSLGEEKGTANFTLYEEWIAHCDITAYVSISNYYDWEIDIAGWGGCWTHVKLGFRFFIIDESTGDELAYGYHEKMNYQQSHGAPINFANTNEEYCSHHPATQNSESFESVAFEKGKKYIFGITAHTWAYSSASMGAMSSIVTVTHNTSSNSHGFIYITWDDRPPLKPSTPNGPTHINIKGHQQDGVEATYTTSTTDPDMEGIYYQWYFEGYANTGWDGPYKSGEVASYTHTWTYFAKLDDGTYKSFNVKVRAKGSLVLSDISEWSDPLPVKVPRQRANNVLFSRLMDNFPLLVRLFEKLLIYQ